MAWLATVLKRFVTATTARNGWRPVRVIVLGMLLALPLMTSAVAYAQDDCDPDSVTVGAECTDPLTPVPTNTFDAPELEPTYQTVVPTETPTATATATATPTPLASATPCLPLEAGEVLADGDPCASREVQPIDPNLTATALAQTGTPDATATPVGVETVSGVITIDADGDGALSNADIPAAGVTVSLYQEDGNSKLKTVDEIDGSDASPGDLLVATTTTDASGAYNFSDLQPAPESYWVRVDAATVPEEAAPGQDIAAQQILATGTVDFLLVPNPNLPTVLTSGDSAIGGLIFNDDDLDNEYEPGDGETGIDGVRVTLLFDTGDGAPSSDDIKVETVSTAGGFYEFTNLGAGFYIVVVDEGSLPSNYIDAVDIFDRPDQNPRKVVIETAAEVINLVDFAYALDTDGDNVPDRKEGRDDRDDDGIPDYLDSYDPNGYIFYVKELADGTIVTGPQAGVTVTLLQDGGTITDDILGGTFNALAATNSVTTNADGSYRFELFDDSDGDDDGLQGTNSPFTLTISDEAGFDELENTTENIYTVAPDLSNLSPFTLATSSFSGGNVTTFSRIPTTTDTFTFYTGFSLSSGDEVFNNHIPLYSTSTLGSGTVQYTVSTTTEQTADAGGSAVTYTHTITNTGTGDDSYEIFIPTNTAPAGDATGVANGIRSGYDVVLQLCAAIGCGTIDAEVDAGVVITTPIIADGGGQVQFRVVITPPAVGVSGTEYDVPAPVPAVVRSVADPTVDQTVIDVLNLNVGCIEGRAYVDGDNNGTYDEGGLDVPLGTPATEEITVFLSTGGSIIPTGINPDADGFYRYEGFAPATYEVQGTNIADRVAEDFPSFTFSVPEGTVQTTTIPSNASSQDSDCREVDFRVLLQSGSGGGGTNEITGFAYFDLDANGIFNSGVDTEADGIVITATGPDLAIGGESTITASDGTYTIGGLATNSGYTITSETIANFTAIPSSQVVVTGASSGAVTTAQDFRYIGGSGIIDGGTSAVVSISADGPDEIEPGEEFEYDVTVRNNSDVIQTGIIIDVNLDGEVDYQDDSFPGPDDLVDEDDGDLQFAVGSLVPGESISFDIEVDSDDDLEDGDQLESDFSVSVLGVQTDSESVETDVEDPDATELTDEELQQLLDEAAAAAEDETGTGSGRRSAFVGSASEPRNASEEGGGLADTDDDDTEDEDDPLMPNTGYRLYPGDTAHAVLVQAENIATNPVLTVLVVAILVVLGLVIAGWGVWLYTGNAPGILGSKTLWYASGGVFIVLLASVVTLRLLLPSDPGSSDGGIVQNDVEIPTEAVVVADYPAASGVSRQLDSESFVPPEDQAERLVIPAIAVDTELVTAPRQGLTWDVFGFTSEVAHLNGTAFPGTTGNSVIAGHIRTYEGLSPFSSLTDLEEGDVIIARGEEVDYIYTVTTARAATPGDSDLLASSSDETMLTLITCSDWSTTDWAYLMRFVVQAELTSVEPVAVGR